eukprot:TRINITY_DN30862_c0_g1_i1.p1 TRINITY_DN30862_c0_g1~~TRINITY_DN30862_c0_g1_i1.p1  ORF type:complete len:368 (+),score=82.26 TRINITY_DN30862_c0_g1_i1:123-1106(+)
MMPMNPMMPCQGMNPMQQTMGGNPMMTAPMMANPAMPTPGMPSMPTDPAMAAMSVPGQPSGDQAPANPMMANPMMANPMMTNPMMANPMMTNPMMMNPMMGMMNPMAMMSMMMNPMMMMGAVAGTADAGNQAASGASASKPVVDNADPIHPQVRSLCRDFNVEERLMKKLNMILQRRPETFSDDIKTLREKLALPRAEIGVLMTQLERGSFVSKRSMDPEMIALIDKYSLDNRAAERLAESMSKRKATKFQDLKDLDARLASADRPSGLLMKLLQGLDLDGKLPHKPGSGAPVHHRAPAEEDDRRKSRRRSRSRSRSRRRSRSRSRS